MKKILAISEFGKTQMIFESATAAAKAFNITSANVLAAIEKGNPVKKCGFFFDELFDEEAFKEEQDPEKHYD